MATPLNLAGNILTVYKF